MRRGAAVQPRWGPRPELCQVAPKHLGMACFVDNLPRKAESGFHFGHHVHQLRAERQCGLLHDSDRILFRNALVVRHANVIFDLERTAALKIVHGYLDDLGIAYCGRYGDWGYMWTDESFKSGEQAAEKALERAAKRESAVQV